MTSNEDNAGANIEELTDLELHAFSAGLRTSPSNCDGSGGTDSSRPSADRIDWWRDSDGRYQKITWT